MGHLVGKDLYRKLGEKIDNLTVRTSWNEAFYNILKELYTQEEADLLIKMPFGMSNLDRIVKVTKYDKTTARKILEGLCTKGLVVDLWYKDEYHYAQSPMIIGIFEFTMMRTGENLNSKEWARLFYEYLSNDDTFFAANVKHAFQFSPMRSLAHEETIADSEYIEILDYEKATSIVEDSEKFAISLCSCRHEKHHVGKKECDVTLENCTSFGWAADYLIRNNLAKEVSKTAMLENFAQSKELGLVFNADNVKSGVTYVCHCCKCCCNALMGISKHGYPNIIVTSNFIPAIDESKCSGCGKCSKACPINVIEMVPLEAINSKKKKYALIDKSICLGCGVCALKCSKGAITLVKRDKRVITPDTTFERVILQCLDVGTLQNQLFDNPNSITQKFMRGFIGGFLRLPSVKRAITSDTLRSTFLKTMKIGAALQGKGWLTEI